jgi:MoxR-like ATPase
MNIGPPGVGKTRLVKALAQNFSKTLIKINLADIGDRHALHKIFHDDELIKSMSLKN